MTVIALLASTTLNPSREQAREWAVRELAKPEYQAARPNLFERAIDWLYDQLSQIQGPGRPAARVGELIVIAIIAVIVIWAVRRTGGLHREAATRTGAALEDATMSSSQHYAEADSAARQGDWTVAVVERFRGMVRELEERTILVAQRGRTADEIAAQAASAVPALGARFAAAARAFDDVRYGGAAGTAAQYDAVRELASELSTARPARLAPAGASAGAPAGGSR